MRHELQRCHCWSSQLLLLVVDVLSPPPQLSRCHRFLAYPPHLERLRNDMQVQQLMHMDLYPACTLINFEAPGSLHSSVSPE